MGCTNSFSSISILHETSRKQSNQPLTTYKALRTWINASFPELAAKPYKVQTDSNPSQIIKNSRDYHMIYSQFSGQLNLKVVVDKANRYKAEVFDKISKWIFKVRKENQDVEATGFMLSPKMAIVGIESGLAEYHALFEDGSTLMFKDSGMKLASGISLVELNMTNEWIRKHMNVTQILMSLELKVGKVVLLYYSMHRTILQEIVEDLSEIGQVEIKFDKKSTSKATPGSPIFDESGKVIAVLAGDGTAVVVRKLLEGIETGMHSLDTSFHEKIEEAVVLSGITIQKPSDQTDAFKNMSVFIDTEKSTLIYSSCDDQNEEAIEATSGSSVALTPFGVLISGQDDLGDCRKSWLFNGKSMQSIKPLKKRHVNHSSIYFNSKVFVVSGSLSSAVEIYDFQQHDWEILNNLPAKRAFTSLIATKTKIFLFGGKKSGKKLSRSILCLNEMQWEKIQIKLPQRIFGMGTCDLGRNKVLVFGGIGEAGGFCSDAAIINLKKGIVKKSKYQGVNAVFGSFPVSYSEDVIVVYSNNGEKVSLDRNTLQFIN